MSFDPDFPRVVSFTRGEHCSAVAHLLAADATRVEGDIAASLLKVKPDLMIMRRAGSFDLVSTVEPMEFAADEVGSIVAAVAGGPHSLLAAAIASRLADALGVKAEAISVYRRPEDRQSAVTTLEVVGSEALDLELRPVEAANAVKLIDEMPADSLLVVGAPGGSWFHRQFMGPGRKLVAKAPAGALIVRHSPVRAFQRMEPITGLGRYMRAREAGEAAAASVAPVCEDGKLIGIVRREALQKAAPDTEIGALMEPAPFTSVFEPLSDLIDVAGYLDHSLIPLVDKDGRLVGGIDPAHLPSGPPG